MQGVQSLFLTAALLCVSSAVLSAEADNNAPPANAKVYIVSPLNGASVPESFTVVFGLKGMGVAPAGTDKALTGHHHLVVDAAALPDLTKPLGAEVKHFGAGQTETELSLPKGKHTLQLIFADKAHMPFNPPLVSEKITVDVK